MSATQLARILDIQPFPGFRLHLSDGTFHDIPHPELISIGLAVTTVYVPPAGSPPEADADQMVRVTNLHITKLVPLPAVPAPAAN